MEELFIQSKNPSIVWITAKFIEDKIGGQYYSTDYIEYERILKTNKLTVLKDVISEYNGGPMGFQLHSYDYLDQGVPVLRTKDMKELTIILDDPIFISQEKHNELKGSKTYPGDIIISKTGQIGVVAVVPKIFNEANLNQALCNIRVKEGIIDNYFLAVFLNSKYGQYQFIRQGEGKAVQNGLTKDEILDLQIPVISPEIQKYIGDKVRKAEELREEAKRLKKEAETFLYEMIQLKPLNDFDKDMFSFVNSNYIDYERLDSEYYKTKYITLEKLLKSKKVTSFKDIIIESKYGASVPVDYTMVGIPFIRGNNLTDNEINIDDIVYLNKKLKDEVKDHHVNTGDILITRSGTVGISAVVDEKCDGFSFGSFMIKLRIDMRIWNPYYIAAFLNSFWGKWQIERLQNGAVQQNINLQEIGRIIIPIISKENQDKIEELIKNYINKKRQSKQLFQEAKQDVEDLIEGNFDMSKVKANS
ncbi:restriction endonuclease subunit S [Caldifermentibacillus hisashii]|uniref:restriction endonuclease subunit S n=1 Tax=Bacillaceae TaxID=186817 RepID=UPI0005A427CF|nr:restriction endonuclease subunit S [Caldibacillus thermoamylovorans]